MRLWPFVGSRVRDHPRPPGSLDSSHSVRTTDAQVDRAEQSILSHLAQTAWSITLGQAASSSGHQQQLTRAEGRQPNLVSSTRLLLPVYYSSQRPLVASTESSISRRRQ